MLRDSGRLLVRHGLLVAAIITIALLLRELVIDLALRVSVASILAGELLFCLAQMFVVTGIVCSLLVMRRRDGVPFPLTAMTVALGSVLVPYLVIQQSTGDLFSDFRDYTLDSLTMAMEAHGFDPSLDVIPKATSLPLLLVVAVALGVRLLGSLMANRMADRGRRNHPVRGALLLLVGYAEAIWIIPGVLVLNVGLGALQSWWDTRALAVGAERWWADIGQTPLGDVAAAALGAAGPFLAALAAGLFVPVAWLAIGAIVYGMESTQLVTASGPTTGSLLARIRDLLGQETVDATWERLAAPDGRFGALLAGLAMILKSPVALAGAFCGAYTLINAAAPYLIWLPLRGLLRGRDGDFWEAAAPIADNAALVLALTASTALLAAGTDRLLRRFGSPPVLRLPDDPEVPDGGGQLATPLTVAPGPADRSGTAPAPRA